MILYYTTLYYTILYYTILHSTIQYAMKYCTKTILVLYYFSIVQNLFGYTTAIIHKLFIY